MKLSDEFPTTWPDDLLREFARDVLKVQRFSAGYLDALRCVLGNQARADHNGTTLDMNTRVDFATVRTMTTIVHQMHEAGRVTQQPRVMGEGRTAQVYVYGRWTHPAISLELQERQQEARDDGARTASLLTRQGQQMAQEFNERQDALNIADTDVPY